MQSVATRIEGKLRSTPLVIRGMDCTPHRLASPYPFFVSTFAPKPSIGNHFFVSRTVGRPNARVLFSYSGKQCRLPESARSYTGLNRIRSNVSQQLGSSPEPRTDEISETHTAIGSQDQGGIIRVEDGVVDDGGDAHVARGSNGIPASNETRDSDVETTSTNLKASKRRKPIVEKSVEEIENALREKSATVSASALGEPTGSFSMSEELRQEGHKAETEGDSLLACQLYARSVELDPHNGKAWQDMAKAEGRKRRKTSASANIVRQALVKNPKNPYLWQSLGFLMFRMKKYDEARTHFQTGIARDPNHASLYSTWAFMESVLGNYPVARDLFTKGCAIPDGGARVYHNWGVMELKLGNKSRAIQLFNQGLELEPENPYIWETLGSLAKQKHNFDEARNCYRNALKSEDNNVVVLEAWGKLESAAGNEEKARELFRRGVKCDARDTRVLHSWSVLEYHKKHFDIAKDLIQRAVLLVKKDAILWHHFARVEEALSNHPRARAMYNRACSISPNDWRVWDSWSAMEHKLGNHEQAEKLLRESFRLRFDAKGDFEVLANRLEDRHETSSQPPPSAPSD